MKEEIEKAVAVLRGKPLWGCLRAADMATFSFGDRKQSVDWKGRPRIVGDWALHVQCAWRIRQNDRVVVGNVDLYYPAEYEPGATVPEDFDWDTQPNRRDKLLDTFFDNGNRSLVVQEIEVDGAGALRIALSDDHFLEILPNDSIGDECWRFFEAGKNKPHLVVTAKGLQT